MVEILENVRGKDVFVLQSTCAPANDSLMEILVIVDALKHYSAGRITAAIPYLVMRGKISRSARVAITAKVVANMLTTVGIDRLLTNGCIQIKSKVFDISRYLWYAHTTWGCMEA